MIQIRQFPKSCDYPALNNLVPEQKFLMIMDIKPIN